MLCGKVREGWSWQCRAKLRREGCGMEKGKSVKQEALGCRESVDGVM